MPIIIRMMKVHGEGSMASAQFKGLAVAVGNRYIGVHSEMPLCRQCLTSCGMAYTGVRLCLQAAPKYLPASSPHLTEPTGLPSSAWLQQSHWHSAYRYNAA